jgi:hypothetical protein
MECSPRFQLGSSLMLGIQWNSTHSDRETPPGSLTWFPAGTASLTRMGEQQCFQSGMCFQPGMRALNTRQGKQNLPGTTVPWQIHPGNTDL